MSGHDSDGFTLLMQRTDGAESDLLARTGRRTHGRVRAVSGLATLHGSNGPDH